MGHYESGELIPYEAAEARAAAWAGSDQTVTHAGICVVRYDGGPAVLLTQRAFDETDDPAVAESWEFPGGSLDPGEEAFAGAAREFGEELGFPLPPGDAKATWLAPNGIYQGFVYEPSEFPALIDWVPTPEVQAVAWVTPEEAQSMRLRPEMADFDWSLVSGNEENMDSTTDAEAWAAIPVNPIPLHGVVAPEEVETGDKRGFAAGSMTQRSGRLPFRHTHADVGAHDGAVPVGSVDRMMRQGGLIHWEGQMMPSDEGERLAGLMQFFGGRYGVSVDGDKGSLDSSRVKATGVAWFDAVRAAGLTAVDIPAFEEAYVAFGPHPDMPPEAEQDALVASGNMALFGRGPGYVTNPVATNRIHDYWTKPGQPGFIKVGWGTPGDFARAKALIGAELQKHSPDKLRFLNQIIAQWHFDALGIWPATHAKLDRAGHGTVNPVKAAADTPPDDERAPEDDEFADDEWQVVLTSSGKRVLPPMSYFDRHPDTDATVIEEPDKYGIRRTHGYAAERGVCHIGYDGRCVEAPVDETGVYAHFHLGRTKTEDGYIKTGLITYGVQHRDAEQILSETPTQAHFDDLSNAWAAVRLGTDERGIWYSGVVLPTVDEKWITAIEASGQVSGEWKGGVLRTLLTVNVPGFPVLRSSAVFGDDDEVLALVASAFNNEPNPPCAQPTPAERMAALRYINQESEAAARMAALRRA